jgi:hypothetical protein
MSKPIYAGIESVTLADLIALDPPSAGTSSPGNPIKNAEVVFAAFDDAPNQLTVVYGKDRLAEISASKQQAQLRPVVVQLASCNSDELEQLAAMVKVIHGHHDLDEVEVH